MNKWTMPLVAGVVALILVAVSLSLPDRGSDSSDAQPADHALRAGIELFGRGEYEAAIDMLGPVPEGSEFEAQAKYYEGSAHLMLRNLDAAFDLLQQAQQLTPDDPHILYALGVASFKSVTRSLPKGILHPS